MFSSMSPECPTTSAPLRTEMSIDAADGRDTVVLHVRGELDMSTADQFRSAVSAAMAGSARAIVVDVAALTLVDSTGIREFMAAWHSAAKEGRSLRLRHPNRLVGKVLRITGVDRILLEDAVRIHDDDRPV